VPLVDDRSTNRIVRWQCVDGVLEGSFDVVDSALVQVIEVLLESVFDGAETLLSRKVELLLIEKPVDGVVVTVELGLTVQQERFAGHGTRVSVRIENVRCTDGTDGGHVRSLSLVVEVENLTTGRQQRVAATSACERQMLSTG